MANVIEVSTDDDLKYQFYPVSSGSVQVKVRASNDAHIALALGPQESDPVIEVFLGGWANSRSVIRRNRIQPDKVAVDTPGILHGNEYRSFWLEWDGGVISVGKENDTTPFLTWTDPEPFPIYYVGVCTGWGAAGSWRIEDGEEFNTPDKLEYIFKPVTNGALDFEYRGPHNCHLCLAAAPVEGEPIYEIILGGWENTKSVIRHNKQKPEKVSVPTPDLVNPNEYKKFVLEWRSGRLFVSDKETGVVILEWTDPSPFPITHFGVRTGWGARGHWRIKHFPLQETPSVALA